MNNDKLKDSIAITFVILLFVVCLFYDNIEIEKTFTIEIKEDTIADWKAISYEEEYYVDSFNRIYRKAETNKLIGYMKKNNLRISPGIYKINQDWKYKKIRENLVFEKCE